MEMKKLLAHLGEEIFVESKHYNGLNGRYILSGITQTVIKENDKRKWKSVLHLTEPDNDKVSYQIDPHRYDIRTAEQDFSPPSPSERIKNIQAEIRKKIQNHTDKKPSP